MGTSMIPQYADVFMAHLEENILEKSIPLFALC